MRHKRLDIYDADLYLATTKREWATLRRRVKALDQTPDSAGSATFATFHPNDGGLTVPTLIIWVDVAQHKSDAELVNTAAHESAHVVSQLFDHIGHAIHVSDEPFAYLVGFLTQWIWEQVKP